MAQFHFGSQSGRDPWRGALERIPTILGRLSYVAKLRNPGSNTYYHPSLSQALGAEEADRSLRHSHYQVFSQWLALGLEDQKADLTRFLASEGLQPDELSFRELIPPQAREVERRLFITDLETLLKLLSFGSHAASPEE